MIAMALACGPKLLIADEPTTALDVTVQAEIIDLIRAIQREEGMAVIFITHDMGVIAEVADRTLVMFRGNGVEVGPTTKIFAEPKHDYTRALISSVPKLGAMTGKPFPEPFDVTGAERPCLNPSALLAEDDGPPVLEVRDLTTRFVVRKGLLSCAVGRVHAVEDVSFSIRSGETLSLVGESGCGKSSTSRSIMRLVEPDSGSIKLCGQELMGVNASELRERRRVIQMVFQDPFASLNPRLKVGESIAEPLIVNGTGSGAEIRHSVGELLEEVGLDRAAASRYPHEFSGGQRQRICIARAIAVPSESHHCRRIGVCPRCVNQSSDCEPLA
ncbi:ABC-type glutathione transport system ATPase component [Bradyrhizobium sp. USDA 4506]